MFGRCIALSTIVGLADESGIKVSGIANAGNNLTRYNLSEDNTMKSGGDLGRFHIAVGNESRKFSEVHRDVHRDSGVPVSETASWRLTVSEKWRSSETFSVLLFPPAAHEGVFIVALILTIIPL